MSIHGSEQLTKTDIKRIQDEIDERTKVLRPRLLKELSAARAQGDLSENYEYTIAKRENNQNNSRIRYLEKMLKNAIVVNEDSADDVVGINNTVTVYYEEEDYTEECRIVTPIRCNSLKNLISNESPIGKALMGHRVGDRVGVVPDGGEPYYIVIKNIEKTGESEDDQISRY